MAAGRILKLAALAAATALLATGAWSAREGLRVLAFERREAAAADARLSMARSLLPKVEQRERFAKLNAEIEAQASRAGFDPSAWAQRRIQRMPAPITRKEAQDQLAQLGSAGSGRLMAADGFELAVLSREAGLFTAPAADDKGLLLAINGTLYFPLAGKP
ncbi:hypothetical protein ACDW_01740 [Acidovorax sp. DW039]|jgi:hypothetical protein|uniref:hypothetical protein n=1 Tax=Acidovorax sp. DW039 TaxID=3095606 RepID=UPI0030910A37|nr:hypothetical protein ACDW_01740 [Acidovorax sp. DW039]